eukprot:363966-Chlamydomonas_euryale.AAC.1
MHAQPLVVVDLRTERCCMLVAMRSRMRGREAGRDGRWEGCREAGSEGVRGGGVDAKHCSAMR